MSKLSENQIMKELDFLVDIIKNSKNDTTILSTFVKDDKFRNKFINSIQGVLELYKAEKEKNKELYTQENINAEYEIGYAQGSYQTNKNWKDKIKAKIEEKEKRYEEISKEKFLNKNETQKVLNAQIAGYKELLEEWEE